MFTYDKVKGLCFRLRMICKYIQCKKHLNLNYINLHIFPLTPVGINRNIWKVSTFKYSPKCATLGDINKGS